LSTKPLVIVVLAVLISLAFSFECLAEPVVVVYGGGDDEVTEMFADLIEERVDADVMIVTSPEAVRLASALPNIACIMIYADHRDDLVGLPESLPSFFLAGGGLVGMTEVCYEPSGEELSEEVFPIYGNTTIRPPKRVFTYTLDNDVELADGLPGSFDILSIGTYASVDDAGAPLDVPGDQKVVYRDSLSGVPLVVAHESEMGGRSVSIPGIMVVKNQRVDVYYGNLFLNENFNQLLINSIEWAMGNSRFTRLEETLDEKVDEYKSIQEELRIAAEGARENRKTQRTYSLLIFWAVGLIACGLILVKMVLVRQE
jgi:hypothetical protein